MNPIEELKNEHRGVETMLRVIEVITAKIAGGHGFDTKSFDAILEFLTVFVDRCHHGKEEELLFPALESIGMPHEHGLIGVLLHEYEQGRRLVAGFRDAAKKIASGDSAAGKTIEKTALDYVALMDRHIEKEEDVLFPMAFDMLGMDKQEELQKAFEQLEEDRIGPGKHEEFHQLLHRLEQVYIS